MDIQAFQRIVSDRENKLKQIHIVLLCLNFVEEFPDFAPIVGCFWDSDSTFLINTAIFSSFIDRKANTINRGFRFHNFSRKMSSRAIRQKVPSKFNMDKLPDQTNWIQRFSKGFTKKTTENEAINWKYCDYKQNKPSKPTINIDPAKPVVNIFPVDLDDIDIIDIPDNNNDNFTPNIEEDLSIDHPNQTNTTDDNNNNDDFTIINLNNEDDFSITNTNNENDFSIINLNNEDDFFGNSDNNNFDNIFSFGDEFF